MSRKDGLGAVDLLQQQHTDQHMGPGHGAEGEEKVRPFPDRGCEPIGTADDEDNLAIALIGERVEAARKIPAAERLAALVQCDERAPATGSPGQRLLDERPFGSDEFRAGETFFCLQFDDLRGPGKAFAIDIDQGLFRARFGMAKGEDANFHGDGPYSQGDALICSILGPGQDKLKRMSCRFLPSFTLPRLFLLLMLSGCAAALPLRPVSPPETIRGSILRLAEQEWGAFNGQTIRFNALGREIIEPVGYWEDDRRGSAIVAKYWNAVGIAWTGYDVDKPWSAAFISWIMAEAGVSAEEMPPSATHAGYLRAAIAAEDGNWRPHQPQGYAPRPGDLICATRAGQKIAQFDDIPAGAALHCDIVVMSGVGRLWSIGGNVRNSVSRTERMIDADGRLAMDGRRPWFLILENRYPQ